MKKKIAILGSTGSIGKSLIDIIKKDKKNIEISLVVVNKNIKELLKQVSLFKIKNIIVTDFRKFLYLKKIFNKKKIKIFNNFNSFNEIFKNKKVDYTLSAISGLEGLEPTMKIIKFTKKIAIANKESLICAWPLIERELVKNKTKFVPIDSEHYSVYSLLGGLKNNNIEKVYLTASGGPFNNYPLNKFKSITLKSALKHPNWKMGKKITIDSATMMNKVFEIIEANKIFNISYNKLNILIHPKSYVHAIVKFNNGLTKILIHDTNMTIPIFNSLHDDKKKIKSKDLNFSVINDLNFEEINVKKFPVVKILKKLPTTHSLFETIIVTANDTLVNMFINKKIKFIDISKILIKCLEYKDFTKFRKIKPKNIEEIKRLNEYVRLKIRSLHI